MAQKIQFPKKDQAVVTDVIEGLTIKDYTLAIGKIVKPVNVLFVSRISNGRICVYLSSQELVDKLTEPGTKVNIDPHTLTFRPLISKAKRIIISNVCPIIPHYVIEDKIKALDITPVSQITCIRASINDPEYAHVMSFRRQVYINPEDIVKLPKNMRIEYDSTTYWIYFSGEKATCFLCKEEGHLAKQCPMQEPVNNTQKETLSSTQAAQNHNTETVDITCIVPHQNKNMESTDNTELVDTLSSSPVMPPMPPPPAPNPNAGLKRTLSDLSSSTLSTTGQSRPEGQDAPVQSRKSRNKSQEKRLRKTSNVFCSQQEIDTQIAPAKNFFLVNSNNYPLEFDNLTAFLKETYGSSSPLEVAHKFTTDIPGLVQMLRDTYPSVDRKLKNRITRIIKKIEAVNNSEFLSSNDESDINDSESSSISQNGVYN